MTSPVLIQLPAVTPTAPHSRQPSSEHPQDYIVVIGGANMDLAGYATQEIVIHDSNIGVIKTTPGGVARNIAQNIAQLGCKVSLLSVVGQDLYGEMLLSRTYAHGVDVSQCLRLSGRRTSTYLSVLDNQGEMLFAINDMEITTALTPEALVPVLEFIRHAKVVMLDCNLASATLDWLFEQLEGHPGIMVDPVSTVKAPRIAKHLARIHTLKPNLLEASKLSGLPIPEQFGDHKQLLQQTTTNQAIPNVALDYLQQVSHWFAQQGLQRLVISLGSHGVFYSQVLHDVGVTSGNVSEDTPDTGITSDSISDDTFDTHNNLSNTKQLIQRIQPAFKVSVVNVTGAGDAMMAGLAYGYYHDLPFDETVRFAQACSALTITSDYTNHPQLTPDYIMATIS